MTKHCLAVENTAAEALLPPAAADGSGIGVNYIDAYLKPLNVTTDAGDNVACKRKGLKIILAIGGQSGEAIIRRAEHGPDPRTMLRKALEAAAGAAGAKFSVENGSVYLEK